LSPSPEGEGWDGGAFRVKSKSPPSKSSPSWGRLQSKSIGKYVSTINESIAFLKGGTVPSSEKGGLGFALNIDVLIF